MFRNLLNRVAAEVQPSKPNPIPAPLSDPTGFQPKSPHWSVDERDLWLTRKATEADPVTEKYWRDTERANRILFCSMVIKHLSGQPSVLDYGSHVGTSFRLITDARPETELFAVEPNDDAVAFLKSKFPAAHVLQTEDEGFLASGFPVRRVDVSCASGVFYAIEPRRVRAVLKKLCAISDAIVIGDELNRVYEKTPAESAWCSYHHPYRYWLRQHGFKIVELVPAPEKGDRALNGVLVAVRI